MDFCGTSFNIINKAVFSSAVLISLDVYLW